MGFDLLFILKKNVFFVYLDKVLDIKDGAPGAEHQPLGKINLIQMKNQLIL
jgi:hypothetical protein